MEATLKSRKSFISFLFARPEREDSGPLCVCSGETHTWDGEIYWWSKIEPTSYKSILFNS